MSTVSIQEAQAQLPQLIMNLRPGEEVMITDNDQTVAKLVAGKPALPPGQRAAPGLGQGMITIVADDDEHLSDFAEYLP